MAVLVFLYPPILWVVGEGPAETILFCTSPGHQPSLRGELLAAVNEELDVTQANYSVAAAAEKQKKARNNERSRKATTTR